MNIDYSPYIERLRSLGLRPTKQRLTICKVLFDRPKTFHFTIEQLKKIIDQDLKNKISLATLYNTIHAFKKNGHLKEISLKGNKSFFDTNVKNHHHFYDEDKSELIDIGEKYILLNKIPEVPSGKKIKDIEVTVSIATDNQIQKKTI